MSRKHGELEAQILETIWSLEEKGFSHLSSNEIHAALEGGEDLALTTVLTVLSRLCDKELVIRERLDGKSLRFRSALSRSEQAATALVALLDESNNPELAVAHFLGALPENVRDLVKKSLKKS